MTSTVNVRQMCDQVKISCKVLKTHGTFKGFDVTEAVNCGQVLLKVTFPLKSLRADVTQKSLDVTNTVHSSRVQTHALPLCELPTANVTRVLGVRMLWSWRRRRSGVARKVRRVVVSADR